MVKAVGVKFKHAGKVYYFDPAGKDVEMGDKVIVETAKGLEFATVVMGEEKIQPETIVSPLKRGIRQATQEDIARQEDTNSNKAEARNWWTWNIPLITVRLFSISQLTEE